METMKAISWERRRLNGLLDDFKGLVLDVGAGRPPAKWWELPPLRERLGPLQVDSWDRPQGDAHFLQGVPDRKYDWLVASHILEHLPRPDVALENWIRVVKLGGSLLISVPHRDLYERRQRLPSRWNPDHKRFYLPDRSEPPHTVGLAPWFQARAKRLGFAVLGVQTGDWGYNASLGPDQHPMGEYQIDALLFRWTVPPGK